MERLKAIVSTQWTTFVLIRMEKTRVVVPRKKGNCQGSLWMGRERQRKRRRMMFRARGG